jgi:hypothetical protein
MKKTILVAALAVAASGAFAQAVQSSSGVTVSSGTGVVVTPGVSTSTTVTTSAPVVSTLPAPRYSGAVMAQAGTSESVSGTTRTTVTRYWANVPAGVERDADFQRWQRLK